MGAGHGISVPEQVGAAAQAPTGDIRGGGEKGRERRAQAGIEPLIGVDIQSPGLGALLQGELLLEGEARPIPAEQADGETLAGEPGERLEGAIGGT